MSLQRTTLVITGPPSYALALTPLATLCASHAKASACGFKIFSPKASLAARYSDFRNSSGNFATFAAIRRASFAQQLGSAFNG
jgi:hypothetical protein